MKLRILILSVLPLLSLGGCTEEEFPVFWPGDSKPVEEGPGTGPVTPPDIPAAEPDWSRLTASAHPRIIFTDADFSGLAGSVESNPVLSSIHSKIMAVALRTVGAADLERVLVGKRLLDKSREAEQRIIACAYAYKVTGEAKYLAQAEHDIVTVCNFTDWNAKSHYLDVGEMAAGVGLGYDWLYNDLQASTKDLAMKALNDFAFTTAINKVWNTNFYSAVNNWNQVCNGGLVCAALAVYESNPETARAIIEKAIESNLPAMQEMYSPDGNYPEGYSYWNYGTIYEALMLTALETATGSDAGLSAVEGFAKTGKYMLFMETPLKQCFNYSDSAPAVTPCFPQWYFAWKFNDLSLLAVEKDRMDSYGSASEVRLLPLVAYYAYRMSIASLDDIPVPSESIFRGEGATPVVLIHDNWKNDMTDKFLGIKAGKANTSHGHMDAGSFVYDAFGVRWSADLGLQSYATLEPYINLWNMNDGSERWGSFRYNNFNHSTITVNDAYHKVAGAAVIKGLVNADGQKGATVDITAPLASEVASAERTIYMEGDDLIIKDDITAQSGKSAKVRWTMVTLAEPTIEYGAVTLRSKTGRYMYLKTSSSTGHKPALKTWSTVSANSYDASNAGYYECGYEVTVAAGASATITVRLTPEE
ncbi:MAG: heparinase II/III-family protein [Clostridium sp.]|nr:heparinase II/III-family protein [Bacteroides sp.]MCM1197282.1 heparinase II/III-family protein [Clostridium sp.]